MSNLLKPLFISALLCASTTAFAQETTDTAATEEPAADPAADLNMGTEVVAEIAPGTPYIRAEHGDWAMRCLKANEGEPDPCQLYQLLQDQDGNNVAEISMFPLPNGVRAAAGATIVVPLETLLTAQLQMSVDGASTRRYPYTFCNAAGCVARVGFTQDEVNQFKRGNAATLRMVNAAAPDGEVILNLSLTGFTAGYEAAIQ